jgi:hypothetical protein
LCIPTVQLEDVLSEEGRKITMRKVDGPSLAHARGAVKLGILDAFRPNGPDGMWLITGESVRRAEQDSRHDQEHDRGKLPVEPHPVLAVSGIGCGFCGSSRSRMAFKA